MNDPAKYFDYNATTPMSKRAREAWLEASQHSWQNPSSLYREAGLAKQRLEDCREELGDFLGIDEAERILFTSGATEANNEIIRYLATRLDGNLGVSAIEHPCVEAPVLQFFGEARTREIPVDPQTGVIDLEVAARWIQGGEVAAVSVMAANNETGALQPWEKLSELCREAGIWFHCDAAQWIGKLPSGELGQCDFLTGDGHKFGGGKGVGFLVLPAEEAVEDFHGLLGGPQEDGRRAGTENLPAVAAMVEALKEREGADQSSIEQAGSADRDKFEAQVTAAVGARILGQAGPRLWNTSMIVLPHTRNVKWLTRLSRSGFSVSTGSACSAGKGNPSRVMAAMGLEFEEMGRVLRFSGGWGTTEADWISLAEALGEVEQELRDS